MKAGGGVLEGLSGSFWAPFCLGKFRCESIGHHSMSGREQVWLWVESVEVAEFSWITSEGHVEMKIFFSSKPSFLISIMRILVYPAQWWLIISQE